MCKSSFLEATFECTSLHMSMKLTSNEGHRSDASLDQPHRTIQTQIRTQMQIQIQTQMQKQIQTQIQKQMQMQLNFL